MRDSLGVKAFSYEQIERCDSYAGFTFRARYALLEVGERLAFPSMKLLQRVNRKIAHMRFAQELTPNVKQPFSVSALVDAIAREPENERTTQPSCILSYDDISLAGASPGSKDFGGKASSPVLRMFLDFVQRRPDLKHTFFFVPAPRHKYGDLACESVEDFSEDKKFHPLVVMLKDLESSNQGEVALHGYHHLSPWPKYFYPAFEFEFLSAIEAERLIQKGLKQLQPFFDVCGFKAPAWGIGQLSGSYYLPAVLAQTPSICYACLSSPSNGLNYALQKASNIYPTLVQGILNIPQNISVLWSDSEIEDVIAAILKKKGIINIQTHFSEVDEDLKDGISEKILEKIEGLTDRLRSNGIAFKLCREVAGSW